MTVLNYDIFNRQFGLRRSTQLMSPIVSTLDELLLPKYSILHYLESDGRDGPSASEAMFSENNRLVPIKHVFELSSTEGNPRKLPAQEDNLAREFRQRNKRFRTAKLYSQLTTDALVPGVVNYCFINRRYKYVGSEYVRLYSWKNTLVTLIDGVNTAATETKLHQFLFIDLPKQVPSVSVLTQGNKEMNLSVLKKFKDDAALTVLEFWKWLSTESESSVFSRIEKRNLKHVNIILRDGTHWTCFNMGVLFGFRKATGKEIDEANELNLVQTEEDWIPPTKGDAAIIIQKKFIRYLMAIKNLSMGTSGNLKVLDEQLQTSDEVEDTADATEKEKEKGVVEKKEVGDTVQSNTSTVAPSRTDPAETQIEVTVDDVPNDSVKVGLSENVVDSVTRRLDKILKPELLKVNATADSLVNKAKDAVKDSIPQVKETEREVTEAELDEELASLEKLEEAQDKRLSPLGNEGYVSLIGNDTQRPDEKISEAAVELAEAGELSAAQYRRLEKLGSRYKEIKYPGTNKTMEEMSQYSREILSLKKARQIEAPRTVFDKSMLKSNLEVFDRQYIETVMDVDLNNVLLSVQNAGICVVGLEKERMEDATGKYDQIRLKLQPVEGAPSTVWMKLPVIDKDGTYQSNSVRYSYRKSRIDVPIRKIAPDKVALTSYYGKITVVRSNKKVTDWGEWLRNHIMTIGLDNENDTVTELTPAVAFRNDVKTPRLYTTLAMRFQSFRLAGFQWMLDWKTRSSLFSPQESKEWETHGSILVGKDTKGDMLLMDKESNLFAIRKAGGTYQKQPLPPIEEMLGLDRRQAPVDIIGLKVLGKIIPVGFILAYHLGLEKLINSLGVTYRRVPKGGNLNLADYEYRLVFGDESLIFDRRDTVASMILAGLNDYHRELKKYSVYDLDNKDIYLNLLEAVGLSTRYLREIDLLFKMFVDPITKDVLEEMGEPTQFMGLLVRSAELLKDDSHPDEVDPEFMRIRGFERIPGMVYGELVKSIRAHNSRMAKASAPVEMNPYAVWRAISTDPAVMVTNDINPIQNLKEVEAVTYGGHGGRNSRTMVKHTREYHQNDLGTMSEATVDSSDVGINVFLSADPNFISVRGVSKRFDAESNGPSSILSTSSLLAPAASQDDAKRVGFISIQNSHTVACEDYKSMPVRTGEEAVMVHRVSDMFASTAKGDGEVKEVTDKTVKVVYKDGTEQVVEIGRRYGAAAGLTIPHDLVSHVKVGQKVKMGDVLTYNTGFFEVDDFTGQVNYKGSLLAKVVVFETGITDEDSSVISRRLAKRLGTKTTKIRDVVLSFDQSVRSIVKLGTEVESTDVLCLIEDAVTAGTDMFDASSLETLKMLGSQAPSAKVKGVVDKIEVYYHGDLEDMSESLRKLAKQSDKNLADYCRQMGKKPYTGKVNEGFRSDGQALMLDNLVIRFYITSDVSMGNGDKTVYASQMKSVVSEVMDEPILAEDGTEIDVQFGRRSIFARIVSSPDLIGTTTTLLKVIGKKAFDIYNK